MHIGRKNLVYLSLIIMGITVCYACVKVAKTTDRNVRQDAEIIIGPEPPMRR